MSDYFSLQEMLEVTQGRLINLSEDKRIYLSPSRISTDTRKLKKGDFYLALEGERFNGNDFVLEAHRKGAIGAMTNNPPLPLSNNFFIVQVPDTLKALHNLAKFYRQKLALSMVGITGSNGKTTVKELTAHILSTCYSVAKSEGNLNNQIGVPLSILQFSSRHQVGVLELGMNHPGEISNLSRIVQPNIGVITNIHHSHVGFLRNMEGIARAKAEMIPFLNKCRNNYLILNADCMWTESFRTRATCRVLTFGMEKGAEFKAENVNDEGEKINFRILFPSGEKIEVNFPHPGLFNVYNILAVSAVSFILNVPVQTIKIAVENFTPPSLHCSLERYGGCTILNDCYNANPESMESALCSLKKLKGKRKIAILADMLELGEYSSMLHRRVGRFAAHLGIDALFSWGEFSEDTVEGAKNAGLKNVFCFNSKGELLDQILAYIKSGDCLLVKGSRRMQMEEIVEVLKDCL